MVGRALRVCKKRRIMKIWVLWTKREGAWAEWTKIQERTGDYIEQIKAGIFRANSGSNEDRKNAAALMQAFVLDGAIYTKAQGKSVLRALRHFDEVGVSNEICESLEEALDEGLEKFKLR